MMYRLIISEKPSVSASIAYCIGATEKVSHGDNFYWRGNGYIVTNAIGHLFGIGMPEDYGYESGSWLLCRLFPKISSCFRSKATAIRSKCSVSLSTAMM